MDHSPPLISRRAFGVMAGAALCGWQCLALRGMTVAVSSTHTQGGVSLAGAEFGTDNATFCNTNPGVYGRDYTYPEKRTLEYFAEQGLGLLRLPFRWERLQPQLQQPLDAAELKRIKQTITWAAGCGARVILDLHNYGRYQLWLAGRPQSIIIDEKIEGDAPVPRAAFADFWKRLAGEFAGDDTIAGLGLMNEPHDMGTSDWKTISQTAVDAVRSVNRDVEIMVAGDGWSNAHRFEEVNGPDAWIDDPAGRVAYEAHCYFDADASGKYRLSYADELRADPQLPQRGVKRLGIFLDWCHRNQVTGFLGEFGIPGGDPGWNLVLENALQELVTTGTPACWWAAGEWWGDYPLSLQPQDNLQQPAPQLAILQRYLAPRDARSQRSLQPSPTLRDGAR